MQTCDSSTTVGNEYHLEVVDLQNNLIVHPQTAEYFRITNVRDT